MTIDMDIEYNVNKVDFVDMLICKYCVYSCQTKNKPNRNVGISGIHQTQELDYVLVSLLSLSVAYFMLSQSKRGNILTMKNIKQQVAVNCSVVIQITFLTNTWIK